MFVAVVINVRYESLFLKWLFVVQIAGHQPSFVNELKLSDFKQVLTKYNINSEFSGGVLWCCDNTVAVRRVSPNHLRTYQARLFSSHSSSNLDTSHHSMCIKYFLH